MVITRKKWVICSVCEHFELCLSGKARLKGLGHTSFLGNDIGCFNYEIYKKQIKPLQKRLFD